jgi:hypothetical protein
MTGHAFQCLAGDQDVRDSLAAVRTALRPGGRFVFETRESAGTRVGGLESLERGRCRRPRRRGRPPAAGLARSGVGPGELVSFSGTTADRDGAVLRIDRARLRFLDVAPLDAFLAEAGFAVDGRYGDWDRGPVTGTSREIIAVARRR